MLPVLVSAWLSRLGFGILKPLLFDSEWNARRRIFYQVVAELIKLFLQIGRSFESGFQGFKHFRPYFWGALPAILLYKSFRLVHELTGLLLKGLIEFAENRRRLGVIVGLNPDMLKQTAQFSHDRVQAGIGETQTPFGLQTAGGIPVGIGAEDKLVLGAQHVFGLGQLVALASQNLLGFLQIFESLAQLKSLPFIG